MNDLDWKEKLALLRGESDGEGATVDKAQQEVDLSQEKRQCGILTVMTDRKGRKGKTATIVEGFTLEDNEVAKIAADLKKWLGTGGSSRGGEILLQGDWKDRVKEWLKKRNFKVK